MNTRRLTFIIGALLVLLLAVALRLDQLATFPPGPHYDEAANLLIGRSVAFGGARFFPMVEAYQGREVLYYYLAAPLLQTVHDGMFSFRITSVFANLITIAASMAFGRLLLRGWRGAVVGLLVGALMALNFHQVWLARQAFRAVTLPMMQALALAFLLKGLAQRRKNPSPPTPLSRRRREGSKLPLNVSGKSTAQVPRPELGVGSKKAFVWLIIGGIFAGGAIYTYNSSRLFPLWLGIAALALLWWDRRYWRVRIVQGLAFFVPLIIVAAPMAVYAFQRPDVFFGRLNEVTQPGDSISLVDSALLHARMFFIQGDPYFRYNIPERPYFTLPEGVLLLIGLGACVYRAFTRRNPIIRTAHLLILLSPLMVIPSVISVGGLPPSHMRSLGMVPLIFAAVALGIEFVLARIAPIIRTSRLRAAVAAASVTALLLGGIAVRDVYLGWASRADVYYESDADLAAAAAWLQANAAPDERIYIAARDKGHPTAMVANLPNVTWLGTDSLFTPAAGETGIYVFPRSAPPAEPFRARLEGDRIDALPLAPDGRTAFEAFRITGESPTNERDIRNPYVRLIGVDAPAIPSGEEDEIVVAWQIEQTPPFNDYTPIIQLEDPQGNVLYRGDVYTAGTNGWRVGETLYQMMRIEVPPATPPGEYRLRAAWVGRAADAYSSYVNDSGQAGIWAEVGSLTITRPDQPPDPDLLSIENRADAEIAPGVTLIGWSALPDSRRQGEIIPLTLYWRADTDQLSNFTFQTLLGDSVLLSGQPLAETFPPENWRAGDIWAQHIAPRIPPEHPAGIDNVSLVSGENARVTLGDVQINSIPRVFDLPEVEHVVDANFDGQLRLYGYNIHENFTNYSIEFAWQMLDNKFTDYKIFVHLVDRSGNILAQQDVVPLQNTYPTSLWLNGEVVVDTVTLPTHADAVELRVGVYLPETNVRLTLNNQREDYALIKIS